MKFKDFIAKIHIAYKGKAKAKAPTAGSPKYEVYMSITNDKLSSWAEDSVYNWGSLFTEASSTVAISIPLPEEFIRTSDSLQLVTQANNIIDIHSIKAHQRNSFMESFYVTGFDPKVINFTKDVLSMHAGRPVSYGFYQMPPVIENGESEVVCDSLKWLAFAVAAELARNDPAKDDQFANLTGLASTEYQRMAKSASKIVPGQVNRIRSNYPRMGRSW